MTVIDIINRISLAMDMTLSDESPSDSARELDRLRDEVNDLLMTQSELDVLSGLIERALQLCEMAEV